MEELKYCKTCVMDGSAPDIELTATGCNFCDQARKSLVEVEDSKEQLAGLIERIKEDGKNNEYDCLIGLSGGLDSSFTLYHALKLGLRPYCFSLDNYWRDLKAENNVQKLVGKYGLKWELVKVDRDAFSSLQAAFIQAGQMNIEIPTDHVLMATTYRLASEKGIKWVLSGGNTVGESIMPKSWGYQARDLVHIKDVYKKTFGKKLKGVETCGLLKWNWYHWIKGIRIVNLPDYLDYNLAKAKTMLKEECWWEDYGDKHEENPFTKWFQNFYLYERYGIDKRKAHYSSLIVSGQMTRKEALERLKSPPEYPDIGLNYLKTKYPKRSHTEFKTDEFWYELIRKFVKFIKKYV